MLRNAREVANRMLSLVQTGTVVAQNGRSITLRAESICVHGDTPDAVNIARVVRSTLQDAGIGLTSFSHMGTQCP